MKTYYIFRHGETFATKAKRGYGLRLYSAPILEEGKPAIVKLAQYLKKIPSDYNACSPYLRTMQTAEIVSQITGKKFVADRRIREYGIELPMLFKRRVLNFLMEMERSEYQNVLICTHAIVIEMIMQYLTLGKLSLRQRMVAPLPGVLTIIKNKQIQAISFNETLNKVIEKVS